MADTEAPVAAPPKEKKKKRSVKSSEKSDKSKAAAPPASADCAEPQPSVAVNGDTVSTVETPAAPTADIANDASDLQKTSRKVSINAEVTVAEVEPAMQAENSPLTASGKPRAKFSWSVEADDVPSDDPSKVALQLPKKSLTPDIQPPSRKEDKVLTEVDEDKMRELAEAFLLLDFNQDGFIDKKDLQLTYATLGRPEIPDDEIQHMLDEAKSPLDFESFVQLLGYKTIELDPEETLLQALGKWDAEGTGLISEQRIRHDLMTWGDKFTQQEVDWALEDAPLYAQQDVTMIDYVEFCKILCGLRKKTSN